MGHYIRILSPTNQVPSVGQLRESLAEAGLDAVLTVEAGADEEWDHITLAHKDGTVIADIERNDSSADGMVADEIAEFLEEIAGCKPDSAAVWLKEYLPTVRTIYAFQLLRGTDKKRGWEFLGNVKESIFSEAEGIIQADGEGFTDENGYHILWQFSNSVKGPWWMGILKDKEWIHFQMNLGNKNHRDAFFRGEVPEGVTFAE